MNFVTTNIRIPEDDYLKLKAEAAKQRKSLAAVIREKIGIKKVRNTVEKITALLNRRSRLAGKLRRKLKDFDIIRALREMRYEGKW